MLEKSYSMVDRVLLLLGFENIILVYCCVIEFSEIPKECFFPKTVISAFIGFVLYLYQDLNCLIKESRFLVVCNISSVIFSVAGRKMFRISVFERGILSKGSCRLKFLFIVYFEFEYGGIGKTMPSVKFSFSLRGNSFFLYIFLGDFCCVLFLIHDE